ncbi:fibronectin type III domain-containing protein [Longispora sp. K20-0274]|uniref:fibronectin type III domain-containing protein n=1 Tax=Longispora sp. K20-0274 TaxID=3088255 RepID=UPI00399B8968
MAVKVGRTRKSGVVVTLAVTVGLLAAVALTVFGLGIADKAVAVFDSSSWVWSAKSGELGRINGRTAAVDTRHKLRDSQGHQVEITQNDRYLIVRDLTTGKVSSLDLTTLQVSAVTDTAPGAGVTVVLNKDVAFVIDGAQGAVRQIDPLTLTPIGQPLRFPPGLRSGGFDDEGRLWLAVPSEGTVVAVNSGAKGADATVAKTVPAAEPRHDIFLSVLDKGVAVLDQTAAALVTITGDLVHRIPLPLDKPAAVPDHTSGSEVPVTVSDDRHVYVVHQEKVRDFAVPDQGTALQPAVAWAGWFYVADTLGQKVYVIDGAGTLVDRIKLDTGGGPVDLDVREGRLFINAPGGSGAQVVDEHHKATPVNKYPGQVAGGDAPPVKKPEEKPPTPPTGPPSAPGAVTAVAGNASATVTWTAAADNGLGITKYVVTGGPDPKPIEVGGSQRTVTVPGLTNGTAYTFQVHAVNAKGPGPKRAAPPVTPTRDVPDPPATVAATANPDGTVKVTWPEANGQGHKIVKYSVTAVSAKGDLAAGDAAGTELVIGDKKLAYGTQYAFTVVAVNDIGAGSKASPVSPSVTPFAKPEAPKNLAAASVAGQAGAVTVSWGRPAENGRALEKYVVSANGKSQDVPAGDTSVTLTGFGNGTRVDVKATAVNAAGPSAAATATATTVSAPTMTVTGHSATVTEVSVDVNVGSGGGSPTCVLTVAGKTASAACNGAAKLTVGGLAPSTDYPFTVVATNVAGSSNQGSGSQRTNTVQGVARCNNNTGSSDPAQRTWCDNGANAMEVRSGTSLNSGKVGSGRASNGGTYDAICITNGQTIKPYVYNQPKNDTSVWVRINFEGSQGYIPFAWFNLNGYDINSTGPLPGC